MQRSEALIVLDLGDVEPDQARDYGDGKGNIIPHPMSSCNVQCLEIRPMRMCTVAVQASSRDGTAFIKKTSPSSDEADGRKE